MYLHKELFTHLFYWLFKANSSGLTKKDYEDPRDFKVGIFGWGAEYKAKSPYKIIKARRVLNQGSFNTCQWCASTVCKENDEKLNLSERSLVQQGMKMGLVSGNGYSDIDSGDKAMKDWGIVDQDHFDNDYKNYYWPEYVSGLNRYTDISAYNQFANQHKISSYWKVKKRGDILKLLDDGKMLKTAMPWYTGFNQGGGFKAPWLITKPVGYQVGYHCYSRIGYINGFKGIDSNKKIIQGPGGVDVYIGLNSYGKDWGGKIIDDSGVLHEGLFFVSVEFSEKYGWESVVNLDTPLDVAHFIIEYNKMNVKADGDNNIYFLENGKKRRYSTVIALTKSGKDYFVVDKNLLAQTPDGLAIN